MLRSKLDVRPQAEQDIENIWSYIVKDSPHAANSMVDQIREAIDRLVEYPRLGRARLEFGAQLRSFTVGSYTVFYVAKPGLVEISRVLHGSRDISSDDLT